MAEDKQQYRRNNDTDENLRLLAILDERVLTMTTSVDKLIDKQNENPCKTHDLRLKYLERIMWFVAGSTILLVMKAVFSLFSR